MIKCDESQLSGLPPFRKLDKCQIREILNQATTHRFEAGATVFSQGAPIERFYLLLDGHIRVLQTTSAGHQIIALHFLPGQLFGILSALGFTDHQVTAVTANPCHVLAWPIRLFPSFLERYDGFADAAYREVGLRLASLHRHILELATQHVEQRVACAILRLVTQMGRKVEGGIEIGMPITRQNLSDMTGTTLHTVSRLLSGWERDGILVSHRRKITITSPHRLVILSGSG